MGPQSITTAHLCAIDKNCEDFEGPILALEQPISAIVVFKPGILVYHAIHDKNPVTLERNLRENISSGTLLFFKEPSTPCPPPEPPDVEKCLEPEAGIVITKVFKDDFMADILPTLPTLVLDLIFFLFLSSFLSFGNEDTIFDPGIVTFHKPVAFSMEVFHFCSS
ncbi:hypothetical protein Tco_1519912 [Tanacetum coccineum]